MTKTTTIFMAILIDKVYFSSDLKDVYVGNNVQGFRKGSTEAIVEIIFKNPDMIEVNVTETPPEEKLNGEKVTTTFIQIVESGTVEETKDFQIDTHQVQFTDATLSSNVTSPTTKTTTTSTKQTTTTVPPTTTAPATTPATTTQTTTTPTTTTPMTTTPTTTTATTTTPTTTTATTTTPITTTPTTTTQTTTTPTTTTATTTTTTTPTTTTATTTTPMTTTTPITTTPTTTTQTSTTPTTTTATTTTPITTTPTTTTQTTTTPTTTKPTTTTASTTTPMTTTTPITTTPTTTTQTTTTPTTTTATTTSPTTTKTKTTTTPTTTTQTTTTPTTTTTATTTTTQTTTKPTTTTPMTTTPTTTTATTTTATTTSPTTTTAKTTTTSHNLTATTSIPTSTTRPITTSATTTSTTVTATTTRPTTTTTLTSTAATKSSTTASNTSTATKTIPTSATYTTSTIPTSTRLSVTTNTSVEPLVEFNVQVLMRNMTWTPAYNNTNSTEYQQLLHEVMLMEANIQKYMLSMGNSSSMSSSNGSMPVSEIFDRMIFLGIRYMNGRVMVMFDLVFKARHMTMPDGVSMTVDSSMVRTIVSTSTGVNQMDVHIVDLGSVNSTTSGTRNSTNASTTTAVMSTASEKTTLSTTTMSPTTTPLKGSCGGNYAELMGSFASPNYPGNYPNYQSCYYYINVPSGYKITVTFTEFKTESCCDYVKVYDGLSTWSPLLLTLRGSYYTNITVNSTANKMLVYFKSDSSAVYSGFRASYSTDIEDCSMDQIKCSSDILSPCVSIYKLCDGYADCLNSFDEQHCHNYTRLTSTASTIATSSWYTTVSPPSNTTSHSNIEIRLVNGSNCLEGRVEININGVWGTISTSSFTYREAGVICKQLGFRGQAAYPLLYGYFGQADSTVPVWYTYLYCYTGALRLEDCSRSKYGAGNHYQDVGVRCETGTSEYSCSFNYNCHFLSMRSSTPVYWSRRNGCTGTSSTGPCRGHDGNYYSYYMYLETDYGSIGDTAEMYTTVTFDVTPRCLSFYYHMYGSSINELQVRISSNSDTNGKVVWSKKYQQGNKWHSASVDIPALYGLQIKFVGIRGNSYRGDIGVDEVKLQRGTCDSVCPNNIDEEAGVNCTFSKRNACNYTTESIKGTGDWMYKSYSTPGKNLPPTDVSGRSFGYFFYQSSNGKEGDSTRLFSPYFTSSSSSTVRFYSYFGGRDVGSLRVSTIDDSGKTTSLWYKHGEQANGWLLSCISLEQEANLLLEFVASRSSDGDAAIAVDNVTVSEKPCMFGIAETVCDFDHPYMCGYKVNCSCTQQSHLYKWIRHTGPTASKHTGPESDSESDGYYMYAEATFGDHSDATSLKFPEFRATGSQNLQFKYHMYGNDTGTLMVQAKNKGNNSITKIWSLTGPQKNGWNQICMPLRIAAQTIVELSFVAVRGDGPIGDIAIDDVLVTEEKCPHTASCDFSYGTCDYHVTWNDYIVKWIRGHHVGIPFSSLDGFYFYVVSTNWREGTQTFLFSKIFQAYGTESVSFDYINSPYSKFEVGWIEAPTDNTTLDNIKYSDINTLHTTTSKADHWTKRCVSLGAVTRNISIVFVHTSGVSDIQLTAVDNVEVSMNSCNGEC
ncbi:uncharacterized protein LOC143053703 [Mytilus galloprovincialis]|uniref:uncharacterized protein LOC143053703 n=1 Tax=Mytilus galloprovincialis TaxID=29158 RepID=UPI003F7BEA55